jgi:glycosyltransferase involved in cell wall biosynthesis
VNLTAFVERVESERAVAAGEAMSYCYPQKVLITGGREAGGLRSFAEALRIGFLDLGIPTEIVSPLQMLLRRTDLWDFRVLKILSTTAVFAAPISRRAICVAHGFPCVAHSGWLKTLGVLASLELANACPGAQLVAVSEYSSLQLRTIFNLRLDGVIHNPVQSLFLDPFDSGGASPETDWASRDAITYAGRLDRSKNVDRLLPAMQDLLNENRGLRAWIIGGGPARASLERIAAGDTRVEFLGCLPSLEVRARLRRTKVFVSGSPTEPFGIVYLEALSQGCAVAMPASGGGLEIAPQLIGSRIHLFPASMARASVTGALRQGLTLARREETVLAYSPRVVAEAYLAADARFSAKGTFAAEQTRA